MAGSELLDAGSGGGSLLALEHEAWQEARRLVAGQPQTRVLRVWDEIVWDLEDESNDRYVSVVANPLTIPSWPAQRGQHWPRSCRKSERTS